METSVPECRSITGRSITSLVMNEISISYVIGTHNESSQYLIPLFDSILKHMDPNDEIVVIDDMSDNQDTINTLDTYSDRINIFYHHLNGDFASHKNFMIGHCKGTHIFNIDADELAAPTLLQTIKDIIFNNPDIDLFILHRVNIVHGITAQDIAKYNWFMSPAGYVNWPDQQGRIFKNKDSIRWKNKVHEVITGVHSHTELPYIDDEGMPVTDYALLHVKTIDRQRQQNSFYESI